MEHRCLPARRGGEGGEDGAENKHKNDVDGRERFSTVCIYVRK